MNKRAGYGRHASADRSPATAAAPLRDVYVRCRTERDAGWPSERSKVREPCTPSRAIFLWRNQPASGQRAVSTVPGLSVGIGVCCSQSWYAGLPGVPATNLKRLTGYRPLQWGRSTGQLIKSRFFQRSLDQVMMGIEWVLPRTWRLAALSPGSPLTTTHHPRPALRAAHHVRPALVAAHSRPTR
jgi:hypothetical protein